MKISRMRTLAGFFSLLWLVCVSSTAQHQHSSTTSVEDQSWPVNGGSSANAHYSPLTQINRNNVANLAVAWKYDTHEKGGLQTSPIIVGGVLYGITPTQKVFALNAATGQPLWTFDSGIVGTQPERGLVFWSSDGSADGANKRILVGVMNFLYALDAVSGKPIPSFGARGSIDLREGLGRAKYDQGRAGLGGGPDVEAGRHGWRVVEPQPSPLRRDGQSQCSAAERQHE